MAQSLEKLPQHVFQKPSVPEGYHVEKIDRKKIQEMGKNAEQVLWQNWNP